MKNWHFIRTGKNSQSQEILTHALIGWGFHHQGSVPSLEYEDYKPVYLTADLLGNSSPLGNCESLACDINGLRILHVLLFIAEAIVF